MTATLAARVFDLAMPEPNSGCFIYLGYVGQDGYGRLWRRKQEHLAHRVVLENKLGGPLAPGLVTEHKCRLRCCVNPDHLEAITDRENVARGISFSAVNARKTHCPQGHELSGANLYILPTGHRGCRLCRRSASSEYRRRVRFNKGSA